MFQGQNGKITPQAPGGLNNYPVLVLSLNLSVPKIGLAHPHKNYIFETIKDRAIIPQSFAILA